jgi:hypothetical protein
MLFAGLCSFCERDVIELRLVTTCADVNWAATSDAERKATAAVATALKLKRMMASYLTKMFCEL